MNITLTHTETLNFDWEDNDVASFYAVKLKYDRWLRIFYAEQDSNRADSFWLVDPKADEILDRDRADLIEAWEPISTLDFTVKHVN